MYNGLFLNIQYYSTKTQMESQRLCWNLRLNLHSGLVLLDLHGDLAGNTGGTAEGSGGITKVGAHDVVSLPGPAPQDEGGDAGQPAAEEATQDPRLVQTLGILVSLTGEAETSTAAWRLFY